MTNSTKTSLSVLILTKWYPNKFDPQLGVFIQKQAKALSLWCPVSLIYICPDPLLTSQLVAEVKITGQLLEICIYFKKRKGILGILIHPVLYLMALLKGLKLIRQNKRKINFINATILNRTGIIALFGRVFFGLPYVVTEHWTGYGNGRFNQKSVLQRWLAKVVCRYADAIIVVSKGLKASMQKVGIAGNFVIIPNVVERVDLKEKPTTNFKPTSIQFLSVADLEDNHKNISGVLKAFKAISHSFPGSVYHIIGDGSDKERLETLTKSLDFAKGQVVFHGRQPNAYVYEMMKTVDFVVINSHYETFSVVAAEALNGKPVVTTRCGGPEDFISEHNGIIVPPGDHEALIRALKQMMSDYRKYDAESLNNGVAEVYGYARIGETIYNLLGIFIVQNG